MGLFDFFKKKDKGQPASLFDSFQPYSTYLSLYLNMQSRGNYAPVAAYEKPNGELEGFLYVYGEDDSYFVPATQTVEDMKSHLEKQLQQGAIQSYAILYHSKYNQDDNHTVATQQQDLKAISILYHFAREGKGAVALPYAFNQQGEAIYAGIANFSKEENDRLFNETSTEEGKNYFQDRIEMQPPSYENDQGILIKQSNTQALNHTWGGIFGFDSYNQGNYAAIMNQQIDLAEQQAPLLADGAVKVNVVDYPDVAFKTIGYQGNIISILPIIKTDYQLDFTTKAIQEWEHIHQLEAIVSGRGRDTFGLWFYATDYAENRKKYHSQKDLDVHISGVIFVLDKHQPEEPVEGEEGAKFSEDFTAYMPSNSLPNHACFDFIGQLEAFRAIELLENNSHKAYILTVRLITHEQKDFFTIDLYVTPENMRFQGLEVGMKLTGMFQMQGRIVET